MIEPLTLKMMDDIVQKMLDASRADRAGIESDMILHGKAFYRVAADGSFRHIPTSEVRPEWW